MLVATLLLSVTAVQESITVTATRTETRLADTPASVVVLGREEIAATPAATVDDMLRQVPGFTLFRRAGSRVANPTTQGVTLRGMGASGASRAAVLDDGIPLNDPFGGWVYWGRISRLSLERVEVMRGGGSHLYGSGAMGGVVQFFRRRDPSMVAEVAAGTQSTGSASVFAVIPRGEWRGTVSLDWFDTTGHVLVAAEERGVVDRAAGSEHLSADVALQRGTSFLRLSHFDESRHNGTALQVNDTTIRQLAGGGDLSMFGGLMTARGWFGDQDYHQTFSAVAANRETERLTAEQNIASTSAGSTLQWSRGVGRRHAIVAGGDLREVESGDRQATFAGFVEDMMQISPALSVTAGIRFDTWEGHDAWSPRLAALFRLPRGPAWTVAAYQAFRAPTLNELHRDFRVGNIITLANEELGAETLTAIEAGIRGDRVRVTAFWMEMDDLISNVTLTTTPALITRQRRNVESGRSRGVEVESDWRVTPSLRASAGYLFSDSTFSNARQLPQVPRHQATAQLSYTRRATAALQARWSAMQFDDDLNQLTLDGYVVADAFVSIPAGPVAITLAAENLFDETVEVSATPVTTIGQPRSIRVGLRYSR